MVSIDGGISPLFEWRLYLCATKFMNHTQKAIEMAKSAASIRTHHVSEKDYFFFSETALDQLVTDIVKMVEGELTERIHRDLQNEMQRSQLDSKKARELYKALLNPTKTDKQQ